MNQLGTCQPISNQPGPGQPISYQLGPCRQIRQHSGPCLPIRKKPGPCKPIGKQLGPCQPIRKQLGPYQQIRQQLAPCQRIRHLYYCQQFGKNKLICGVEGGSGGGLGGLWARGRVWLSLTLWITKICECGNGLKLGLTDRHRHTDRQTDRGPQR